MSATPKSAISLRKPEPNASRTPTITRQNWVEVPTVAKRISLAYATGRTIETADGRRVAHMLANGRVLSLGLGADEQINQLAPRSQQPFCVVKRARKKGCPAQRRA
jgi:hypothetical protein